MYDQRVAYLESALRKIAEGRGRFSQNQLMFARNTIEDMKEIANAALAGTWECENANDYGWISKGFVRNV